MDENARGKNRQNQLRKEETDIERGIREKEEMDSPAAAADSINARERA